MSGKPTAVSLGELRQGSRAARRERQQAEPPVVGRRHRCRNRAHLGRFLEDDVRVGSGEPERTDPGNPGPSVACPGEGLVHHPHRKPVPRNVRRRFAEVQVLRQYLVLERQDDLDQTRDSRGCLQMPDIRLHRPDQQRPVGVAPFAQCRTGGLDFDRITQRGAGPVRLQVSHVTGCDTRALQRLGDHALLGDAVGHRQTTRRAILVDRAAPDHGPNPVTVADRVLEPLHDDDTAALAAHITVGGRVEGLAPAVRGQHVRVREGHRGLRAEQDVHAAGQREVTFPEAQRLARLMDCHQRRAARRIDGDRRALQPQPVTDPARSRGGRCPDRYVCLDFLVTQLFRDQSQVVMGAQAHEHTGLGVRQSRWRGARVLHRLPRRLQQYPVLRVDQHGLPVRQPEEWSVEPGYVVDETPPGG